MDGAPDHLTAKPVITTSIQTSEGPKTTAPVETLLPIQQLPVVDRTSIVITST